MATTSDVKTAEGMNCARCGKRLSRKTARLIDGRTLCSSCMFAPNPIHNQDIPNGR